MINQKTKEILIFIVIFVLGAFLRFYHLGQSPPSLNWDEASLGYDSYSILKTGRDQYGKFLPLAFRSFDDYKPPVYVYLTVPSIVLFGLNAQAVRFPSALLGTLTILIVYLITKKMLQNHPKVGVISLIGSLLLAISPWHLVVSRPAFEANVGLFFFLSGVLFLLYASQKRGYFFLASVFFVLSLYSYHSYRLIIPLFLLIYLFENFRKIIKSKEAIGSFLVSLMLCFPLAKIIFSFQGLSRLDSAGLQTLSQQSAFSFLFYRQFKVFSIFQKVFFLLWEISGRYWGYFSPANLFARGDLQPAHSLPSFGPFFFWLFPFWLIGIYQLIKSACLKETRILLYLILVSPVASVFTRDWFALVRTLPILAAFTIISSWGLTTALFWIKEKYPRRSSVFFLLFFGFIFYQIISLAETVFVYLPKVKFGDWQYGFGEIVPFVAKIRNEYSRVIVDSPHGQPFIFFLFYESYPPYLYQRQVPLMPDQTARRKVIDFGPYTFRSIYWPKDRELTNILFVGTQYSLPKEDVLGTPGAKILSDFYDPLGYITARVVEKK